MSRSKRFMFHFRVAGQILAFFVCASARAAEGDSAPTLGMGGAGTANPWDAGAARRNPAAMQLVVQYTARADARYGEGLALGGVLQDSRTSNLGGALAYTHQWVSREPDPAELPGWVLPGEGTSSDERQESSYRLSLGYGFFRQTVLSADGSYDTRRFALALSGVYDRHSSSIADLEQGFDLDASIAGRPTKTLSLGATGHDLLPTGLRDPSVEAGLWWEPIPALGLALDGVWDPTYGELPLGGRAGLQYRLAGTVPVRAGYGLAGPLDGGAQRLGLGLGVQNEMASIDYAFTLHTVGPRAGQLEHALGLRAEF